MATVNDYAYYNFPVMN